MVICLDRGADLRMAQLMPLPLTVSCFSKIQIGFTFLVPAHPGSPGQRGVNRVRVYRLGLGPYIPAVSVSVSWRDVQLIGTAAAAASRPFSTVAPAPPPHQPIIHSHTEQNKIN